MAGNGMALRAVAVALLAAFKARAPFQSCETTETPVPKPKYILWLFSKALDEKKFRQSLSRLM